MLKHTFNGSFAGPGEKFITRLVSILILICEFIFELQYLCDLLKTKKFRKESVPANTRTGTVVRTYPSQRYFYNVQYLCYLQPVIFTGILQILEAAVHSFAGGLANMMNAMKSYQHSMGTLLKHVKL